MSLIIISFSFFRKLPEPIIDKNFKLKASLLGIYVSYDLRDSPAIYMDKQLWIAHFRVHEVDLIGSEIRI
jgi:hypothetical protein